MQIQLTVAPADFRAYPGPAGLGKRFIFTDDLVYLGKAAGTHSGCVTTLRNVQAGDAHISFPPPTAPAELLQYEATFSLLASTVDPTDPNPTNPTKPPLPTGLQEGQITARGLVLFRQATGNVEPARYAITGGTGAYANARGQVTQQGTLRTLDVVL